MPHKQASLGGYADGLGELQLTEAGYIETLTKELTMPAQVIVSASADEPGLEGLTWDHPLAVVAARNCQKHATILPELVGLVACGSCWAKALHDDFVVAMEHDLPLELVADLSYVDEIAVELAVKGKSVELTRAERAEVNRRLAHIAKRRNMVASSRFAFAQSGATR